MKWSRSRTVKVFAVGATAALLLTACSGKSDTPGDTTDTAAAEPVELSIAYWGDFGLTDLVPKYEAENPGVTIKLLEGEYNAQHEALQQELIAGSGAPDIAAIDEGFIVQFKGQADKFTNLLDLGAADYESKYLPWKWQQSLSADGAVQIGLGTDVGGLAMCYRRDLFEAANMDPDRVAVGESWKTWDDFITVGQALSLIHISEP